MRIVVMSDSHNLSSQIIEVIEKHMDNADLFIFLGDGLSDLEKALLLYPQIRCEAVGGNCDFGSDELFEKEILFDGKKIFFCHGHTQGVKHGCEKLISEAKNRGVDICLFGHTHIQHTAYDNGLYIMNPGAVMLGYYGIIDIEPNGIALLEEKL